MKGPSRIDPTLAIAHGALWSLYLLPSVPEMAQYRSWEYAIRATVAGFFYFGIFVYANLTYLLPRFSYAGYRATYLLILIGFAFVYAWAGSWVLERLGFEQPPLLYRIARLYSLTFAFGFINQYFQQQQQRTQLLRLESLQTQVELGRLRAQVNPHFLFNTLHNLYSLTLSRSPQAPDVVLRLSGLMRYLFTTAHDDEVPLAQELTYLEHFVELERLRLSNDRANITFTVQGNTANYHVPPMLLIPFVENAFKHGVETETGHVRVSITAVVQGQHLFFEAENSKPAIRPAPTTAPPTPTDGTGLANVQQRLALLFPDRHQLLIDDQPLAYKITLVLPICPTPA